MLNEGLGWTGLGCCDGGGIGSGTMEACCYVVDFERDVLTKELAETSMVITQEFTMKTPDIHSSRSRFVIRMDFWR